MKNLPIMQVKEFFGTISMYTSTMQPLCTHVDKLSTAQVIFKCVSQPYILVYILNIATCQTCPKSKLAPVSPT